MPRAFNDRNQENHSSGASAIGFTFVLPNTVLPNVTKSTLSQNLHVEFPEKKVRTLCPRRWALPWAVSATTWAMGPFI
jgi:hypothetical protein